MSTGTISYLSHPGERQACRTLAIKADECFLVWLLDTPQDAVWVETHWLQEHGCTAPHLKGTCPNCPSPRGGNRPIAVRAYRSVACAIKHKIGYQTFDVVNMPPSMRQNADIWSPRILDCPDRLHDLALQGGRGEVAMVWRQGAYRNAPFNFRMLAAEHFAEPRFSTFDVRNHMERVWGLGRRTPEGGDHE